MDESGLFLVDIFSPWPSMLIYHLEDEWWARWWPQFIDVVSPDLHDDDFHHLIISVTKMQLAITSIQV
jgi:hypothetical protein